MIRKLLECLKCSSFPRAQYILYLPLVLLAFSFENTYFTHSSCLFYGDICPLYIAVISLYILFKYLSFKKKIRNDYSHQQLQRI